MYVRGQALLRGRFVKEVGQIFRSVKLTDPDFWTDITPFFRQFSMLAAENQMKLPLPPSQPPRPRSLYVHFPFCETKCHYCDFYSIGRERTKDTDPPRFAEALERECALVADELDSQLDTLFFGGGTPSMTPPEVMQRALAPLKLDKRVSSTTEWTMEANPSSVDAANLKGYQNLGVNRISMGVQALRDDLLLRLGRVHSRDKALESLNVIFESGLKNVSVDLLCGVPGQSLEVLAEALERLTQFPITHLSCYLLTLPPHHRMYAELPDEDEQWRHLQLIDQWMTARGFNHYEISNFARPGFEAKHNLAYWKGQSYIGLGPSAHSYDAATSTRWKNHSSLHSYGNQLQVGTLPREQREVLTAEQLHLEKWMLALRLSEGFPEAWLDTPLRKSRSKLFQEQGYIEKHPEKAQQLRLTPRGFSLSESIIAALV
jgi:oxygen-independent coproporphyrinogen-3 oxidase